MTAVDFQTDLDLPWNSPIKRAIIFENCHIALFYAETPLSNLLLSQCCTVTWKCACM